MTRRTRAPLERRMAAHVCRVLGNSGRILVALSGGLDSVALLHLLRFRLGCDVVAAHFDHAMRATSGADALWVRGLCRAWDVPLESARAEDAPASEAAARELRYAFLTAAADRVGAATIVTAHHADDQAETVLFRLARGTGLAGLAGIPVRRGRIVRPLLSFTRAELTTYAAAARLSWREDPSNRSLRFARNRIRHRVLPELERVRPGATRRLAGMARIAAAAERASSAAVVTAVEDVLETREEGRFVLARERLLAYDPPVRARVIRHLLDRLGSRPDRAGTRSAVAFITSGATGGVIELSGGARLEREFDRFIVRRTSHSRRPDTVLRIIDAEPGTGTFVAGGQKYAACWGQAGRIAGAGSVASFDPSSLRFPLELRAWQAGDRIRLAYGSKKLKRLFQERRIGRSRRATVPVLSDAEGAVLWVAGTARSTLAVAGPDATFEITVMDDDTQ